ncbi:hypothetical protein DSO57_1018682 [Entomophthora muscae]|uniref:Uncharacterized protein n=1 Tax=Entomophthora muscae TaxID=34485 RepID=A0ACC2TFA7_9FUNG|nr:hypothetical protein DSO57_1018682 [Entomophthora muscae]
MTPPLALQLNRPQESVAANESTSTQIFGVIHITFTGLIDSMVPASRPWALLGKFTNLVVGSSCWAQRSITCEFPRTPHRLDPQQKPSNMWTVTPTILHLFHNLSRNSDSEDSDCN